MTVGVAYLPCLRRFPRLWYESPSLLLNSNSKILTFYDAVTYVVLFSWPFARV